MSAIVAFLGAAGFKGIKNWVWIAGVLGFIALIWMVIAVADRWHENSLQTAKDAGAVEAIVAGQNQTLEQLGDANAAEESLRAGGERNADRYADCLRDAIEPANCERYNPDPGE